MCAGGEEHRPTRWLIKGGSHMSRLEGLLERVLRKCSDDGSDVIESWYEVGPSQVPLIAGEVRAHYKDLVRAAGDLTDAVEIDNRDGDEISQGLLDIRVKQVRLALKAVLPQEKPKRHPLEGGAGDPA